MMAASRDIPNARGTGQYKTPPGPALSSLPSRQSYTRTHSNSITLGAANPARVSRRKSSTAVNPINIAALTAAAKDMHYSNSLARLDALAHSPKNVAVARPIPSASNESAVVDGPPLSSLGSNSRLSGKARPRRTSDGSRVSKERTKSNAGELRCETCGKGYKHGSCLTKHLWEHTPEWALTSKLLISKHQQVQLLEAASVLVQMNSDGPALSSYLPRIDDENSSESPAASGSSDPIDEDDMSSRTSTPSQDDTKSSRYSHARQDSYSEAFGRSYQSSSFATSAPNDSNGFSMYRQWSSSSRPSTGHAYSDDEQTDLTAAAAQGLVNCSLGTPKHAPRKMSSSIPPVPPLPAKFARHVGSMDMEVDEDDDGVFGTMEQ